VDESGTRPALHFPRNLEPFEYLMFRSEGDPRQRTGALSIAMLDTIPDWSRLRNAFERASRVVVRLRQHVVVPTLPVGPAQWITDPDFDMSFHLRRIRLPEPGSMRQLLDLGAQFLARPFDTARPLWETLLIDGITEGDAPAALVIKIHHAVTDGLGGFELFKQLYDFERDVDRGPLPPIPVPEDLSAVELTRRAARRLPLAVLREASRQTTRAVRLGQRALQQPAKAVTDMTKLMASAQRVMGPSPVPPSPLLRGRGLGRRFDVVEFPLIDIRRAAKSVGGSVNDAFIAAVCGALRMYHDALGVPVDALSIAMPVSLRNDDDPAGGNRFAGARLVGPVSEPDPAVRIAIIREQVLDAVAEPAINMLTSIAPIAALIPAELITELMSRMGGVDVQASNVPGYPQSPYIVGSKITKLIPFGPLPGVPMMIIVVTTAGTCVVGAHYDTAAVTDHELFAKCLQAGFDEVFALAPAEPAPDRPSVKKRVAKKAAAKAPVKRSTKRPSTAP
jgi:diacylglycerol O-acyltransferase